VKYRVFIKPSAERELDAVREPLWSRLQRKLLTLVENPRPTGVQKLQGQAVYRIRIGNYRLLYTIDDHMKRVEIVAFGHRRDVYRS
jgi:mRNA interferase RelE/StbE